VDRLDRQGHDLAVAVETEPRHPSRDLGGRQGSAGEVVEEVALQPALGLGDRPGLGELDGEQTERVTGDDAVELARLFGLADRQERFDAALRSHGLHPHVMPSVDE
jgi:hypothetical protein